MPRQSSFSQRPRVPPTPENYQAASTLPLIHGHANASRLPKDVNYHLRCTGSIRGAPCKLDHDAGFTDEAFTEHSYYEYDDHGYQTSPGRDIPPAEYHSEDSDSVRFYEYGDLLVDGTGTRRLSKVNYSERSYGRSDQYRVHPERDVVRSVGEQSVLPPTLPRRGIVSRLSSRPQSSLSVDVPNAAVYGCGGKCQTLENVCYYFLQVAFTMGVLIGISLGIAGYVLRKSAAKNLQVLLYIGALLSLVCALLLVIQCSARRTVRTRRKALLGTKRSIPMEVLSRNPAQRGVPVTLVASSGSSGPVLQVQGGYERPQPPSQRLQIGTHVFQPVQQRQTQQIEEQPGVPWWRRKDLH